MSLVNCKQFAIFNICNYWNIRKIALALALIVCSHIKLQAVDITTGIVGYWPLECSANDTSINANHAKIKGNPTCDSGKINNSFHFNGTNDYLTLDSNGSKKYIDTNGFSWSLWFKCDKIPKTKTKKLSQIFISMMDSTLGEDIILGFGDDFTEETALSFRVDGKGGVGSIMGKTPKYSPTGGFKDSVWYHATGVCDYKNKMAYLYVNGTAIDSVKLSTQFEPIKKDMNMMIGVGNYDKTFQGYFAGNLDEIRIFSRALNAEEVKYIFRLKANQLIVSNKNINFGNILSKKDSTININLTNLGPSDFTITTTKLSQGKNYTIINGGKILLKDGEIYPIKIKFNPVDTGSYNDTLIIENNDNVLPLKIFLSGNKIININLNKDSLVFADVLMCDATSKGQATLKLTNMNLPDSLILTRVEFSNNVFEFNNSLPIKIALNETKNMVFDFRPAGTKGSTPKSEVTLYFDSCYTKRKIYLSAVARDINIKQRQDSLIIGKVVISDKIDTILKFINYGTAEYRIKNIIKPSSIYFDVIKLANKSQDSILSLDTLGLSIRYVGQAGIQKDSIELQLENKCGIFFKKYYLSAQGAYEAKFDMIAVSENNNNDTTINTGNYIKFPIIIKNTYKLKESEIKDISFDFTVNASQLIVPTVSSSTYSQKGNYITYNLNYQIDNTKNYFVLYSPEFKTALGNKRIDTVKISNFKATNAFAKPNIINGTLTLGNVCQAGGTDRLIIIKNTLNLTSMKPNPAINLLNFDFELIENGETQAIILNSNAEVVKVLFKENMKAGAYAKSIDISQIPNGQYYLILKTPNQELFEVLQVVK